MFGYLEEPLDDSEMHTFEAPPEEGPVQDGAPVDEGHQTEVDREPLEPVDPKVNLNYIHPVEHQEHNTNVEEENEQYGETVFRMASMDTELNIIATPFSSDFQNVEQTVRNLEPEAITQAMIEQSRSRPSSSDSVISPPRPQEEPEEP